MNNKFMITMFITVGLWLIQCTSNLTGTSDDTVIKSAKVFTSELKPAQSVTVQVYEVDDTMRIPAYQTTTDNSGFYSVRVNKGYYNVIIGDDESGAFQDSVLFTPTSTLQNDTLGQTRVLRGKILLQPMDNPQTAIAQIVGTNKYVNVSEDGQFIINGLPNGKYLLRSTSTIPEYTPTFSEFTISTATQDTVNIEVTLIYTGIPVVKNLKLSYDSLLNSVTLTWDTTNYFQFKTFQIYSLNGDYKPQVIGTSYTCNFNFQGGNAGDTGLFAIGILSKSLVSGPIMETVSVVYHAPIKSQFSETNGSVVESPYKLSINVQNADNEQIMYEWDIGATGNFVKTVSPETTLTLNGEIIKQITCISRTTIDNRMPLLDTVTLIVSPGWTKSSEQKFSQQVIQDIVVKDSILYLFASLSDNSSTQLWQSTDANTWQMIGSPPIPRLHSKPIIHKNMFCTADTNGYLMTSTDGLVWEKILNPICSTYIYSPTLYGPLGGYKFPPELFSIGTRLYVKPSTCSKQGDSIFYTEDLTSWEYAELNYSQQIGDYVSSNNMTIFLGYSWNDTGWNLGILTGNHIENVPVPNQKTPDRYLASDNHCLIQGDNILIITTQNPFQIWNTKLNNWVNIPIPKELLDDYYVFTSFKNTIYAVGRNGTFRMNIN